MSLVAGEMKEEEPWRQTIPFQHSLTKRKIGQVWLHHTGHDENKSYGTKTREWQLDLVMHMTEVKRPDTDVSFTLTFPKARERTPENRRDLEEVTTRSKLIWLRKSSPFLISNSNGRAALSSKSGDWLREVDSQARRTSCDHDTTQ